MCDDIRCVASMFRIQKIWSCRHPGTRTDFTEFLVPELCLVQNATLAGGVMVGTASNYLLYPGAPILSIPAAAHLTVSLII
jgi:hypothetical protein